MNSTLPTTEDLAWENVTLDTTELAGSVCGNHSVPTAYWFTSHLTSKQLCLLVIYALCTLVTIILYLDEVVFVYRRFTQCRSRRKKTICVLAVFPVFALTGFAGFVIPLSQPIVDLVANTFMAFCLYNMVELLICYAGGPDGLYRLVEQGQMTVNFATLPVCCMLQCIPKKKLDRRLLNHLRIMVLQVCVVRPIINFVAAIMWVNGTYVHGGMDPMSSELYIVIINSTTSMLAVFGLNLVKTALELPLKGFLLGGKVFVIQMVLATSSLAPPIIKLFDTWGLVRCDPLYIKRVRLDSIYRGVLVISMLVYSITARFLYRREADATKTVTSYLPEPEAHFRIKLQHFTNSLFNVVSCTTIEKEAQADVQNSLINEHTTMIVLPANDQNMKA